MDSSKTDLQNGKSHVSYRWKLKILLSTTAKIIRFLLIFPTSPLTPLGFKPLSLLLSISGTRSITLMLKIRCQNTISLLLQVQLGIPSKIHLIDLHCSSSGSVERLYICGRLSHLQKLPTRLVLIQGSLFSAPFPLFQSWKRKRKSIFLSRRVSGWLPVVHFSRRKHDLSRSRFQLWSIISNEGGKILKWGHSS